MIISLLSCVKNSEPEDSSYLVNEVSDVNELTIKQIGIKEFALKNNRIGLTSAMNDDREL
ncbi:hypothetical protein [Flagellimonas sp. CMM7]|uniref:hypothetical protein n=1 Tax=Flagellimonas sp. CMM7 TaxID=2654676 RepID=UPI0013CFE798|nr:hypothetical protein [Flagellimonas sp. CMM7]UII79285.1 hypothetical protein LV704_16690 [Flagellimonas sp. CMM7]